MQYFLNINSIHAHMPHVHDSDALTLHALHSTLRLQPYLTVGELKVVRLNARGMAKVILLYMYIVHFTVDMCTLCVHFSLVFVHSQAPFTQVHVHEHEHVHVHAHVHVHVHACIFIMLLMCLQMYMCKISTEN